MSPTHPLPPNTIYQFSLLSALMAGAASTTGISASTLHPYTQGIGTFSHIDGELVLLDGTVYQLRSDGSVRTASCSDQLPYAVAIVLSPTVRFTTSLTKSTLHSRLETEFPEAHNLFLAYRFSSDKFKKLKVRTVSGQTYPGQPLSELGDTQKVFMYENVAGTVVGFRSPRNWQGISVAGEHAHFISEDRKFGGHVLEMEVEEGTIVDAAEVVDVHIELPRTGEFNRAELGVDDGGIRKVEG